MNDRAPSTTRLVTLLATDIVGSVDLKLRLGHDRAADLIRGHDKVVGEVVGRHPGAEVLVDTGDGFIISFATPEQAVEAALALLVELPARLGEGSGLQVRAGIHIGEIRRMAGEGAGEGKVFGMAVDSACRLMALAGPNQILASRLVQEEASLANVRAPEGREMKWASHGRYLLKGLGSSRKVFEVGLVGVSPLSPPASGPAGRRVREVSRGRHWAVVAVVAVFATGLVWWWPSRFGGSGDPALGPVIPAGAEGANFDSYVYLITQAAEAVEEGKMERAGDWLEKTPPELRGWEWGHLQLAAGLAPTCVAEAAVVKLNHGGFLSYAALAPPDGGQLVTSAQLSPGGADEQAAVKIWNTRTGSEIAGLAGSQGTQMSRFSGDQRRLILVALDGSMEIWDTLDWHRLASLKIPGSPPERAIVPAPDSGMPAGVARDFVWAVHQRGKVGLWSLADGHLVSEMGREGVTVVDASLSVGGDVAAVAYSDGVLELVDLTLPDRPTARTLKHPETSPGSELRVVMGPRGERVAVWEAGHGHADLYDTADLTRVATLQGPQEGRILGVAFSGGGERLLVTSNTDMAYVFAARTGEEVAQLPVSGVLAINSAISPDGSRVATASSPSNPGAGATYSVEVWSLPEAKRILRLNQHTREIFSLAFSVDGTRLVSAALDGVSTVWTSCLPSPPGS